MNSDKLTQFAIERDELRELAFTQNFKDNKIPMDCFFDEVRTDKKYDHTDFYEDGEILSYIVGIDTPENKETLSTVIADIEAYQKLTHLMYSTDAEDDESVVDLIAIVDYMEDKFSESIVYDRDKEQFFYKG